MERVDKIKRGVYYLGMTATRIPQTDAEMAALLFGTPLPFAKPAAKPAATSTPIPCLNTRVFVVNSAGTATIKGA